MNYTAIIIINHIIGCDLNDDKNKNQEKNVKTKPKNINSWFENLMRYLCSAISRNAKFFRIPFCFKIAEITPNTVDG